MEADQQTNHARIRRELWAAIYRQAHEQSAVRVKPAFTFWQDADYALEQFDKRFAHGIAHPVDQQEGSTR